MCFVASFKLSFVKLLLVDRVYCCSCPVCVVILCVFVVLCGHCSFFTLDAGLLARGQYSEGPATGHFDRIIFYFPVPKSKCWDGSPDSQLPLHTSHLALPI